MDCVDIEFLEKNISKYKRNIITRLENISMTEREMKNHADMLCMVLEYSPRIKDDKKKFGNL